MENNKSHKSIKRKFQVSNGYLLEFDQLARVLFSLLEAKGAKRISRKSLQESTGLSNRQLESLISIGVAMGLIQPRAQILTNVGHIIAEHDMFLDMQGSLEWCHYIGSCSYKNLIWYEIFNDLLRESSAMTQNEWNDSLRQKLEGQYTKRTIGKHLYEEVRFVVDAYTEKNFRKLELLHKSYDSKLFLHRHINFDFRVLAAIIYHYCTAKGDQLLQIHDKERSPGFPAIVFGLDSSTLQDLVETLHEKGWLRYETTHSLNQIRLIQDYSIIEFLSAYYQDREPRKNSGESFGDLFE